MRFLLANVQPQKTETDPPPAVFTVWDRYWWRALVSGVEAALLDVHHGRPHEAVAWAAAFSEVFSSVALTSWKDRLYCAPPNTEERRVLNHVLTGCLVSWSRLMSVLAPRMHRDAANHSLPVAASNVFSPLSEAEKAEVDQVLRWRTDLGPSA